MAELKVNLEEGDGCYYAHAAELLGCFSKAESRTEAIDAILKDIKLYSEWILSIGIDSNYKQKAKDFLAGINELNIIEEIKGIEQLRESCGSSALFITDKEQLSEEQFELYVTIINKLPEELMRIVFHYSKEDRTTYIIENQPNIDEELTDLYTTELVFISRFGEIVEQKFLEAIGMTKEELDTLTLLERVVKVRQGAIAVLRYYYPKMAEKEFNYAKESEFPNEKWTIKKLLRKFIEHERERTDAIKRLVKVLENRPKTAKKE